MFLMFDEEPTVEPTPEEIEAEMGRWAQFGEEAAKVATEVSSEALQPSVTATVVTTRGDNTVMTDGPFVETKEQLGGFYVFECENLDVALALAAKMPAASTGHIEVRPVLELE